MTTYRHSLFVPHGSPMFALHPGEAGLAMARAAHRVAKPAAIVVLSPHWETAVPTVGAASRLETIHEFGGFDPRLYEITYPAAGSPEGASKVADSLRDAGLPAEIDDERGLDHGAWIPLRQMFPTADVPVIPLSLQHAGGPAHAYEVGRALALLFAEGFLFVGSGNITHNLRDWHVVLQAGQATPEYVHDFANWIHDRLTKRDVASLLDYRRQHPYGLRAHPRDEHLLPLFTALGAAGEGAQPEAFHRGVSDGVISMDGYAFH